MCTRRRKEPPSARKRAKGIARHLRKNATSTEELLWGSLRRKQFEGIRFRRQHPVPPYVVDFYCACARLVIEIDGDVHDGREGPDAERQRFLEAQNMTVLRFISHDVRERMADVLETIYDKLDELGAL